MKRLILLGFLVCWIPANAGSDQYRKTLYGDDVVFMYAPKDKALYEAYGATFLAWGGGADKETVKWLDSIGVHSTGAMWCLTAGAEELHKDEKLREAVVRDISGNPVTVPWLFDHTFEGTPTFWGCTNNPVFRAHLRKRVTEEMHGGAGGLHIDDHQGSAAPTLYAGGCFCDYCMVAFRRWLLENGTDEMRQAAGVSGFEDFDYRTLVRRHADTPETYKKVQDAVPLHKAFVDCQLQLAAENVRELGELASSIVNHPITLSANTGLPWPPQLVVTPLLTHLVGEVGHHADKGTDDLLATVRAYRMAETIGKPIAATASGHDWAWVAEKNSTNLVKVWIALGYACGQRLMAPHHQWCFTEEKGTHWYDGPTEVYAPIYRFVRNHRELFRDTRTIGALVPPANPPSTFETHEKRDELVTLMAKGNPKPLEVSEKVWGFPRAASEGQGLLHLVNLDYRPEGDTVTPHANLRVAIPAEIYAGAYSRFTLFSPDSPESTGEITLEEGRMIVRIPTLNIWTVIRLE